MYTAFALLTTDPNTTKDVFEKLKATPGLAEVYEVFGSYDILVRIEAETFNDIPDVIREKIRSIEGITSISSLIKLES